MIAHTHLQAPIHASHVPSHGPAWLGTSPEHGAAIIALLFLPVALVAALVLLSALAPHFGPAATVVSQMSRASNATNIAVLLMLASAEIHLVLVPAHVGEPLRATLFALDGAAFIAVSLMAYSGVPWRAAAAVLTLATLGAYGVYLARGLEDIDLVGVITKLIEAGALIALAISAISNPKNSGGDPEPTVTRKQHRSPLRATIPNN